MSDQLLDLPRPRTTASPRPDVVVLVDPLGRELGVADRQEVHDADTRLHLGFSCYVVDRAGRLLVTRRSLQKRTFPGVWTNSVCGHPAPGEPLADAVRRRARTELGMDVQDVRLVLPEYSYRAEQGGIVENELCPVLVAMADGEPAPAAEEVAEYEWVPWSAFAEQVLTGGRAVSPWCREQVQLLSQLGPPTGWPTADPRRLPVALRTSTAGPDPCGLDALREQVDATLRDFVEGEIVGLLRLDESVSSLTEAVRAAVSGGKRVRATFAYVGWLGAGAEPDERALKAATALELLHAFALVHDDVMDRSATRRWQPSTHERLSQVHRASGWCGSAADFGTAGAILVGDLCLSWADQLLYRCGLPEPALARAKPVYDDTRAELVAGQYLDLLAQARPHTSLSQASRVARLKTAGYTCERPLLLGAALAGADRELMDTYSRYGSALGLAYQLRDDVLGIFGDPAVTGKPSGDDVREGKRTVLWTRGIDQADRSQRAVLERAFGVPGIGPDQLEEVRAALMGSGALAGVEQRISELAAEAKEVLERAPLPVEAAAALHELVDRMTDRSC